MKPKNDDSSESSSIKDSGYEDPENDGIIKNNKEKFKKSKGSTDSGKKIKRGKGSSGTKNTFPRKTGTQETEQQSPPPVFQLQEINSIWASCEVSEDEEGPGETGGVASPLSSRTTIIG